MTTARRGLPPDDEAPGPGGARRAPRSSPTPPTPTRPGPGGARRALPAPPGGPGGGLRRAWLALGALGAALAALIGALYLTVGSRPTVTPAPSPAGSVSAPETRSASSSERPTAGGSSPSAPVPSTSPTPAALDLGEAVVTVPRGWVVYADETVQNERRLVRLREPGTDTRVQAVTLTTITGDLAQACRDLVADQRQAFSDVATSLVVDVPVSSGVAGVSCAFTGTRISDGVPNKTEFTLLRREADGLTLFFRDTVPTAVPADSPVLAQLTVMECAAAATFGVAVGSC